MKQFFLLLMCCALASAQYAVTINSDSFVNPGDITVDNDHADWPTLAQYTKIGMHRAWSDFKPELSTLYLRYSCEEKRMYVLVLATAPNYLTPDLENMWIKTAPKGESLRKVADAMQNSGLLYDGDGKLIGWETYFALDEGVHEFRAHVPVYEVAEGMTQTSGTPPKPDSGVNYELTVQCPSTISGIVFEDCDHDEVKDSNEQLLSGVLVELYNFLNPSTVLDSQTTGADGSYSFTGLEAGIYVVSVPHTVGVFVATTEMINVHLPASYAATADFPFEDNTSLNLVCPGPEMYIADAVTGTKVVTYTAPTVTGPCNHVFESEVTAVSTLSGTSYPLNEVESGDVFHIDVYTFTFSVMHGDMAIASCEWELTIKDEAVPQPGPGGASCPVIAPCCNTPGLGGRIVTWVTPVFVDNSGASVPAIRIDTVGLDSGEFFPVGEYEIIYHATDPSSNTGECIFTITVNDCEDPECHPDLLAIANNPDEDASAPDFPVFCADMNSNSAVIHFNADANGFATDNNQVASIVPETGPITVEIGSHDIVFTVTDVAVNGHEANQGTCTKVIRVKDCQAPICIPPAHQTVNVDSGSAFATVTLDTPTTSDNHMVATVQNDAPEKFPVGDTVVKWTVMDTEGLVNIGQCEHTVTVVDNIPPFCESHMMCHEVCTEPGQSYALVANIPINFDATDNVDIVGAPVIEFEDESGTLHTGPTLSPGPYTIHYTVSDGPNDFTCHDALVVKDCQAPICTLTGGGVLIVETDPGESFATVTVPVPTFHDNIMPIPTITVVPDTTIFPLGETVVTWNLEDADGNTGSCSLLVIVVDKENPTCTPPVLSPYCAGPLDENGLYDLTANPPTPTVSDAVSEVTVTLLTPHEHLYPLGTTTVLWEVSDEAGNTITCGTSVTVNDCDPPVCNVDALANIQMQPAPTNEGHFCAEEGGLTKFVCFVFPDDLITDNDEVVNVYVYPSGTHCATLDLGLNTIHFQGIDPALRVSALESCFIELELKDCEPPTCELPDNQDFCIEDNSPTYHYEFIATGNDNTGALTPSCVQGCINEFPIGTTTVVYEVSDGVNTGSCEMNVTVGDCYPPTCTPPDTFVMCADAGMANYTMTEAEAAAFVAIGADNSGVPPVVTGDHDHSNTYPIGYTQVRWTVVDAAGEDTCCGQTVHIKDCENPQCDIQDLTELGFNPSWDYIDTDGIPVWFTTTTTNDREIAWAPNAPGLAWDNSGTVVVTHTDPTSPQTFAIGDHTVDVFFDDESDDSDEIVSCPFTVRVGDNVPPECTLTFEPPECATIPRADGVNAFTQLDLGTLSFSCTDNSNQPVTVFNAWYKTRNMYGFYPASWTPVAFADLGSIDFEIGFHKIRLQGVDVYGNPSVDAIREFQVKDCDHPICDFYPPEAPCADETDSALVTWTDPVCKDYTAAIITTTITTPYPGGSTIVQESPNERWFPVGTHHIHFEVSDGLVHSTPPPSDEYPFEVEDCKIPTCSASADGACATGPVGALHSTLAYMEGDHAITFDYLCSDNVGVTEYHFYQCDEFHANCVLLTGPESSWSFEIGKHSIKVVAEDAAGGTSDPVFADFEVWDCTSPTCTLPESLTIDDKCATDQVQENPNPDLSPWGITYILQWEDPECDDASSELEIITTIDGVVHTTPINEWEFSLGLHTITITVRDTSNESDDFVETVQFNVIDCGNPWCTLSGPGTITLNANSADPRERGCDYTFQASDFTFEMYDNVDPIFVSGPVFPNGALTQGAGTFEVVYNVKDGVDREGYCTTQVTIEVADAALSGIVWHDLNSDAMYPTSVTEEPRFDGIVVTLYDANSGFVASELTGPVGDYLFPDLEACQSYHVHVDVSPTVNSELLLYTLTTSSDTLLTGDIVPNCCGLAPVTTPNLQPGETRALFDFGYNSECVECPEGTELRCVSKDGGQILEPLAAHIFRAQAAAKANKSASLVKQLVIKK